MDFGVVLQTNPPAWRTVALAKLAEEHGFDYVWTFDSHLLWQEPYVIYSQILAETQRVVVGPMVTNPATRDWTVTASVFEVLFAVFVSPGVATEAVLLAAPTADGPTSTLKERRLEPAVSIEPGLVQVTVVVPVHAHPPVPPEIEL